MPSLVTLTTFSGLTTASATNLDANFTNISAALASVNNYSTYQPDTGAANAYVVTAPAGTTVSLTTGLFVHFKAAATNTGSSTLNVNGTGVLSITNYDGTALSAGQITIGSSVAVVYDGTQYKLLSQFTGGKVPGVITALAGVVGAVTGNASTATALQTARAINGVNFDGSAPITVTAAAGTLTGATLNATVTASSLISVATITSGTWSGSFGAVSGANLTSLTAANIAAGTAGISISGNAATATTSSACSGNAATATTATNQSGGTVNFVSGAGTSYETGTWTPTLGGTATYTQQTGTFTRIGRLVFISCQLAVNVIGSGSLNTISGLPFTSQARRYALSVNRFAGIIAAQTSIMSFVNGGVATIGFDGLTAAATASNQNILVFQSGASIELSGCYET